jgi:hypothetical protein
VRLALLALVAAFAAIYLPDLGHGFVRDDFGWIADSRLASFTDVVRLFTRQVGFYRPLVSLTFSADQAIWQINPFGYAITNACLFLLAAAMIYRLARTMELPASAALLAVTVWAFDIHAPRMALLWISGRTALLLCIFAVGAAEAHLRRRNRVTGVCCLLAMLAKEEAVLLPVILTAFAWFDRRREGAVAVVNTTWPMWAALVVYGVLRLNSGAFGPTNLPAHYPVIDGFAAFVRNVGEYAVRAGLVSAIVILVVTLVVRPSPTLQQSERRVIVFAALWIVGLFAITIAAANRSDLYALAPSIGCALIAGAFASSAIRGNAARFRLACTGLIVALIVLIPVYRQRDRRWVQPADVSASVMRTLTSETPPTAQGRVVLLDDVTMRYGLESAFGTLVPAAVTLFKGPGWSGELRRNGEDCAVAGNEPGAEVFMFRGGRLSRCPVP